ncbi:hypothetical protein YC2023_028146 [Brassica napus]
MSILENKAPQELGHGGFAINFMPCKKGVAGDWCCTKGGLICVKDHAECAQSCI